MIKIYTDGACSGNPGPGGWGAVILYDDKIIEIYGLEKLTTNNRMEILAAIMSLEYIYKESKIYANIDIYTDSNYLKDGITNWIKNWRINNWRGSNKKEVKNKDLWTKLDSLVKSCNINWHWVRAHNGDLYNEKADKLAVKGSLEAKLL